MKRIAAIISGTALLFLLVWGGFTIQQHFKRQSAIKAKLEEAIGRDAGYTETILKMEKDSGHITYAEFFELCNKSTDERTNLIVELRGLYPSINSATKDKLIDFLNAENDAIRAKRDLYRRKMLLSSAMESALEAAKDRPDSEYGWQYYRQRLTRAKDEAVEAAKNLQESGGAFITSYDNALKMEKNVAEAASRSGIRFKPAFKEYDQSNRDRAKESIDAAEQVLHLKT